MHGRYCKNTLQNFVDLPIEAPLWTPSCKIESNNVLALQHTPLQLIYMGVELWAKNHMG
jgi:hypothetical protein